MLLTDPQRAARHSIEGTLVLIGSCGTFAANPESAPMAAAVLQLLYIIVQVGYTEYFSLPDSHTPFESLFLHILSQFSL